MGVHVVQYGAGQLQSRPAGPADSPTSLFGHNFASPMAEEAEWQEAFGALSQSGARAQLRP